MWHFRHRASRSPPSESLRVSGRSFHAIESAPQGNGRRATEPPDSIKTLCGTGIDRATTV